MRSSSLESWFRCLTTQELHDRLEMVGWDRAEIEDNKASYADIFENVRDYADFMLTTIQNELDRRERWKQTYGVNRALTTTPMGQQRFDAVKRAIPISAVLWEFGCGEPTPAGNRQIMSCPLDVHPDTSPSFTIYPGDRGWYCFGCHAGGTVIDLTMHLMKSNDPREALERVEAIARENYGRVANVEATMERLAART